MNSTKSLRPNYFKKTLVKIDPHWNTNEPQMLSLSLSNSISLAPTVLRFDKGRKINVLYKCAV